MRYLMFLCVVITLVREVHAQPMNGSYTVGGSNPDFVTMQEAADSLKSRGVAGPVSINVRPGIYIENGGLNSVMVLTAPVSGVSPTNRITFQPDEAAHGSVENVILHIDQTGQSSTAIMSVQVDYVSVLNITFEDIDSAEAGANQLLFVSRTASANLTVEGTIIEGCRFIGNPSTVGGTTFGTDYGIRGTEISTIEIRNCSFQRLMRSIDIENSTSGSENVVVENNEILASHFGTSATGSFLGHGISVEARKLLVRNNYLDNAGGRGSIFGMFLESDSCTAEENTILNGGGIGDGSGQNGNYTAIVVDGIATGTSRHMDVVNNLINGSTTRGTRTGISARTKCRILHNTIVHPERTARSRGILFDLGNADSSLVMNNIVIDYGIPIVGLVNTVRLFDQTDGVNGLISDYNVFYTKHPEAVLIQRGSSMYFNLNDYQTATGLDSHTVSKDVDFVGTPSGLRLTECQGQDPALVGTPLPGIVNDIDRDIRSITAPFRGADEGGLRSNPMFGDVCRIPLDGTPMSLDAGPIDNVAGNDLAICNYDNRTVDIYQNNPGAKSFSWMRSLTYSFKPTVVIIYDLDEDGHQDVIAAGETTQVHIYWGDGQGGFPDQTREQTLGRVVSMDLFGTRSLVLTEENIFEPNRSYLCVLSYTEDSQFPGLRLLCHTALFRDEGISTVIDTIDGLMYDIVAGNFDGDPAVEVLAMGFSSGGPRLFSFDDFIYRVEIGGGVCGARYSSVHEINPYNTGPFVAHTSNIASADYDGDGDVDFIMTGSVSALVPFLRNDGSLNLAEQLLPSLPALGLVTMDYDKDGDADFVTMNRQLEDHGVSVFINNGQGIFTQEINCYARLGSGVPFGTVVSDFDLDGKADIAIASSYDSVFVLYNTGAAVTDVRERDAGPPIRAFELEQNYPNPFNPITVIRYSLPVGGPVTLKVFNLLGQEVAAPVDGVRAAGRYDVEMDASQWPGGVYFYQLRTGNYSETKKMMLVK